MGGGRVGDAGGVATSVADDVRVWAAGVELVMEELSGGALLPGRICLCGGGSRLPEVRAALASQAFYERLPFARPPEVTVMAPDQIETISAATDLLVDQQDVTPLGLAYDAIKQQTPEPPLHPPLRPVPPPPQAARWPASLPPPTPRPPRRPPAVPTAGTPPAPGPAALNSPVG